MTPTDKAAIEGLIELASKLEKQLDDGDGAYPDDYHEVCHKAFDALPALQRLLSGETREAVAPNERLKALVDKFLAWPLPESVCPDLCTNQTKDTYPGQRVGTNLLTAAEAEEMIKYLGLYPCPCHPAMKQAMRSHEVELRCSHLNGCKNIMEELKEHTNAAQGEDAYLRIYPCDAREILKLTSPFPHDDAGAVDVKGAARELAESIDFTDDRAKAKEVFEKILPAVLRRHTHAPQTAAPATQEDEP